MILLTFFLLAELSRTSGFIDIPMAPQDEMAGVFSIGVKYSLPVFSNDPYPYDEIDAEPNDFDIFLKYGFNRGEVALSMFTPSTYVLSAKYLVIQEKEVIPAIFIGIDDISYSQHISTLGRGEIVGFLEEQGYALSGGGRPPELFSGYVALQKSISPYAHLVFGLGRGRFVGYGPRSHVFNTDLFVLGDEYNSGDHSGWAFGMFMGGSIKFPFGVELIVEMDGRDANTGIKYNHKYFTTTFAISKVEQFFGSKPFSPRYTFGLEINNRFMTEKPRTGTIVCIVQDITSKQLLNNSIVEIRELNKKYTAVGGTFSLTLSVGNYTIIVSKSDYTDYTSTVSVKPGVQSKLVFNLSKTEEALRKEAAAREKEQSIKMYLEQGKIYFLENQLDPAKIAFDMVLSLDPGNSEATEFLAQIEPKRAQLIAAYATEARSRTQNNELAKAIEYWQRVLTLNPDHIEAKRSISDLQTRIAAIKKPPAKPPAEPKKMTQAEIEALYKKGVSYFTAEKYDQALKVFKQVLTHDPNHTGAKDYKTRTEARLKVLGGG
jgi:tetratricopeptide (TPR) repeat protein